MLFDNTLVNSIKDEPIDKMLYVCNLALDTLELDANEGWTTEEFDVLSETYLLIIKVIDSGILPFEFNYNRPELGKDFSADCANIYNFIDALKLSLIAEISVKTIDRFWELMDDKGLVTDKFWKDFDRIKEISKLVWKTPSSGTQMPFPDIEQD